jgi:predicted Zn-dependent peptidase
MEEKQMQQSKFDNGFEIYTETIDNAKTVTFSIFVKAGSYSESDHIGIAHFVEHIVFKGTTTRNAQELMEEIEDVGGYVNAETSFEHTRYYATVPAENWKVAAEIISDIVFNSTLPENEIEAERSVIQEELKMYYDDASSHVSEMLFGAMHESYPNRRSIGGTVDSVGAISRQDLIDFKDTFYQPNNMFVVATGNIGHDDVVNYMEQIAGNLENKNEPSDLVKEQFEPDILQSDVVSQERNSIEQSHFTWGLFGPSASDPDSFVVDIITTILGGSSTSRLYQLIREQRGLCYTINVGSMAGSDSGMIIGYTGLNASKIEEVKDIVIEEFERLRTELVNDAELQRAIAFNKGTHLRRADNLQSANSYIGHSVIEGTSANPDDYVKGIENVTADDIKRVAMKYFTPDNWQFAQILPKK